jgi:hypothetical protein
LVAGYIKIFEWNILLCEKFFCHMAEMTGWCAINRNFVHNILKPFWANNF